MTYSLDLAAQILATRELARQVRRIAAVISLDTDRARLLEHADDLERVADEQERQQVVQQRSAVLKLEAVTGRGALL
jgi:hypothetical protein